MEEKREIRFIFDQRTKNKLILLLILVTVCFCIWTIASVKGYQKICNDYWIDYINDCDCECLKQQGEFNTSYKFFNQGMKPKEGDLT